jgi:hypothetical protein
VAARPPQDIPQAPNFGLREVAGMDYKHTEGLDAALATNCPDGRAIGVIR